MPAGALAGATAGQAAPPAAGANPFWSCSNWYFEPNDQEIAGGSFQLTTAAKTFNIALNSNGFLRDYRCIVRSTGGVGGVPTADNPFNVFKQVTFQVPNGSEFFQTAGGYDHLLFQAYARPWEGNPTLWFDYAQSINPSFTFKLAPEIRYTAGALSNMDDRRSYHVAGNLALSTDIMSTVSTAPTLTFASGIDTWAQPDDKDLLERPNQKIPPGIALQTYRRKVTVTLNGANSNNVIDARSVTGNLQRLIMLVVRDSNNARQDYLTDPITWRLDDRTLANYTQADLFGQQQDFYGTGAMARPQGVYVFPRFFNPGALVGQGWLETSGASKEQWVTTTSGSAVNVPGTVDILVEDLVPLGQLPYELTNI